MSFQVETQTLARAYAELARGDHGAERSAIGDFINEFFLYRTSQEQRQALLDEPIQLPAEATADQCGWAAFCAASAEYLAERYHLRCPAWALTFAPLPGPWYHPASRAFPALRHEFEQTAPEPFRRRNVFCSERVFTNPYPSSREPGTLNDLHNRRQAILAGVSSEEREAYLSRQSMQMRGKPRVTIVA